MQAATQKKLNAPGDDPAGAARVLEVRTDKMNNDQFQVNGRMAETFLNHSDHVLSELSEIILRAKEIAISQSSAASATSESRLGVAEEVSQLYQQAIGLANKKIGDRFIFGGFKIDQAPVDSDGRYQGDDGQAMVEISRDVFVGMNVPGIEVFNTNPQGSEDGRQLYGVSEGNRALTSDGLEIPQNFSDNSNVFDEIQALRISLLTSDIEGTRNTLDRLDRLYNHVVSTRSKIGSRVNGIQNTFQALERHNLTNSQMSSNIEDADMVQVMSDLNKEETVFRNALSSSRRLIQPTLMDFLK